ncbi:MAG TPA: phosphotransferase [Longimicrobiales bacterium]
MSRGAAGLPDTTSLAEGLAAVFGVAVGEVVVLDRQPNERASTFLSEFVSCRLPDGRRLELFCKYGEDGIDGRYGHRGDAAYEAGVYRCLRRAGWSGVPVFHGAFADPAGGRTWLVLERLRAGRVQEQEDPARAMRAAAAWIGRLHAASPVPRAAAGGVRLIRHTRAYYEGWIRRTIAFAAPLDTRHRWLPELGRRAGTLIAPLLEAPRVFIHGEFYPHNLLFRGDAVFAVDWQSAALGAGVLDLAALTERWPADVVAACEREYCRARWPDGAPASFAPALEAARLHWLFRWLGDRPEWTLAERSRWRCQELERTMARLGSA